METKVKLLFTYAELAILDEALSALPYRQVAHLISNINSQIEEANKQASMSNDNTGVLGE